MLKRGGILSRPIARIYPDVREFRDRIPERIWKNQRLT